VRVRERAAPFTGKMQSLPGTPDNSRNAIPCINRAYFIPEMEAGHSGAIKNLLIINLRPLIMCTRSKMN
jgi:hypothetical protein